METTETPAARIDEDAAIRGGTPLPPPLLPIYAPIREHLDRVEALLVAELSRDIPQLDRLLQHSNLTGGKRIRPALVLLSGAACGALTPAHHALAAALEMIHTATLVHDDVLDGAQTRRHQTTINAGWGNKTSVLFGDYLFTHAFYIASQTASLPVLQRLALASNRVCEGEMKQNAWVGNFELTEVQYLQMIGEKTAELCRCACYGGAWLSGADPDRCAAFEQFGQDLGTAFQIIDDILDLVGQPDQVGKTLGTDLKNRKPTLPLIYGLATAHEDQRERILSVLAQPDPDAGMVLEWLESCGAIDYARSRAHQFARNARAFTDSLPPSDAVWSLRMMARFVLERTR